MDLGEKIRQIRVSLGLDQTDFAKKLGSNQPNVSRWESKGQTPSSDILIKIAELGGMSLADLLGMKARASIAPKNPNVTVIGAVQAGAWTEAIEWPFEDQYEIPTYTPPKYIAYPKFAVEVRGPSMNRRYPEGSVLICVKLIDMDHEIEPGTRYIIQRRDAAGDHEMTVKELRVDENGNPWLWPDSDHPEHQSPLPVSGIDGDEIQILAIVVSSYQPET